MGGHFVDLRPTRSGLGGLVALFITDAGKRAWIGLSVRDVSALEFYGFRIGDWLPLKSHATGRWLVWRINWKEID
jgi:hypothetical protein